MRKHLKGKSLFQLIDYKRFNALADKWDVDNRVRALTTWELTNALLSCFVLRLETYREVESTLGISDSTFGDALRLRHFGFFQELCDQILLEIRAKTADRKVKKAIRQILAIDSTEIKVHGSLFSEPGWKQKHCGDEHQAAAKLHVVWNVSGQWIDDFSITPVRKHDSPVSLTLRLLSGKIYVFDRAYNDVDFWKKIVAANSHFVTRLKESARYRYLEIKVLANAMDKDGVLYDGKYESKKSTDAGLELRHIIYRDPLSKKIFHFIASDPKMSAKTVAGIYKQRWAVELLFRWLKGHLEIRRLAVKTKNAVKVLLVAAVLFQLLLQLKRICDRYCGTLWELLRDLRTANLKKTLSDLGPPAGCRWKPATAKDLTP